MDGAFLKTAVHSNPAARGELFSAFDSKNVTIPKKI